MRSIRSSRCPRLVLCFGAFAALLFVTAREARAEIYDVPILVEDEHELLDLLEQQDIDDEEYERLLQLLERPIDLNRARRERLYDLPGLTWPMVDEIIRYRSEVELLRDVWDLEEVGIPADVVRQIVPFARVAQRLHRPPIITGTATVRTLFTFPEPSRSGAPAGPDEDSAHDDESDDGTPGSPGMYFRLRSTIVGLVDVGVVGLMSDFNGGYSHHSDPTDGRLTWLTMGSKELGFTVPYFYVMIDQPTWGVILGSYQAGFGQRLAFDESTRLHPNGFYPDDVITEDLESGTFRSRQRLYGVAGSLKEVSLGAGAGEMDATVFFSMWPYDIYFADVDSSAAGTLVSSPDCFGYKDTMRRTEQVWDEDKQEYVTQTTSNCGCGLPSPLICGPGSTWEECARGEPGARLSSPTLKMAFWELIVGGNVGYLPVPDWRIGLTAYWSKLQWLEGDGDLRFAPSARFPNRSWYGAFGVDFHGRIDFVTLFGEYARTFHGGNAAFLAVVLGWKGYDVELSGRYYQDTFDNPHARGPYGQDDEYLGQRDRDEAGGRLRFNARPLGWLRARFDLDVWYRPTLDYTALELGSRVELDALEWLTFSVGVEYRDKVLSAGGRGEEWDDDTSTKGPCFDNAGEQLGLAADDSRNCGSVDAVERRCVKERDVGRGAKLAIWAQIRADVHPRVRLLLFYKANLWDAEVSTLAYAYEQEMRESLHSFYEDHFAHDTYVYLQASWKVIDQLSIAARFKFLDEEIDFDYRGESYLEGWLQIRWQIIEQLAFQARYRVRGWIDDRSSVRADWGPSVNPEHLVRASIDVSF